MYSWIFSILPGPKWLRWVWMGVLFLAVTAALFQWGFPCIVETFGLKQNTVS